MRFAHGAGALLLVDARHPGLESDRRRLGVAASDRRRRLRGRGDQDRQAGARPNGSARCRELESVFEHSVLPVSAVTGEGLDELWKLIDTTDATANRRRTTAAAPQPPGKRRRARHPKS